MGLSVITLLLFIISIILFSSVKKLEKKYKKMMRGVNNKNLEKALNDNLDNIEKALSRSEKAINECKSISNELKGCVNKVAIMRYKAFEDVGSDLSFSIAILDSYNDGALGPPLENNPEIPPSSRAEGLRLLHGLETNLATCLQTPQEA